MKTKHLFIAVTFMSILSFAVTGRAADVTAAGSGNWSSTNLDAPWPVFGTNAILVAPSTNDDVDVELPNDVTVDSTQTIQYIYGGGTITMAPGSTLIVVGDSIGAEGTQSLSNFDTSAPGNTVIYSGNAFWAKHQSYGNLTLNGSGTYYNGNIGLAGDNDNGPQTNAGNFILGGTASVQQGDSITTLGNLIIGTNSTYDCSAGYTIVKGNTVVSGTLIDEDGDTTNLQDILSNVTINPGGTWNLYDVIQWSVGASLTNNGTIKFHKGTGTGGSITFVGTGVITGNPFTLWNIFLNGTNTISTTITATNFIGLNGTVVFDLANPQKLVLDPNSTNALTYGGNLQVINTGAAPTTGTTYQLFSAVTYGGTFASESLPTLPAGLSWVDNLATTGSITVTGTATGNAPSLTIHNNGTTATLSWDSTTFPGYSVQVQTNGTGIGPNWFNTASGTVSPFLVQIHTSSPAVYYRLMHP
jgi:hypothetical protein